MARQGRYSPVESNLIVVLPMSTNPSDSAISPAEREKLQQLFAHGNKQMSIASFDYANEMFTQCVLGDPGNVIYLKTFLANLKRKYGDKKKKGVFSFLSGSAKKAAGSKKPDQVFKAGIDALKANPWDVDALLSTGAACEELGHGDVAVEYFRAAVEADPNNVEANRICAFALRDIAAFDEAKVCVIRILKARPGDIEAKKFFNDIETLKTIHKGKYSSGDSNQIRDAAQNQGGPIADDEDAMGRKLSYLEQVERRIKKNPKDIANYIELAQHFYQNGDYEKSEQYYVKVVEISEGASDMVERLLDTQKQKLHTKVLSLKEEFEKTRQESTKNEFYQTKEEYDKKNLELATHRIKHHPNHSGYHYEYGILLQQQKQFKEAIGEFQLAKADLSRKGDCLLALGQCFQQIKQYRLAMTHYQEAIEALSNESENKKKALYLAVKLAMALEDYETAEKYGLQLATIDFSYKDLGELLDKVAQKRQN